MTNEVQGQGAQWPIELVFADAMRGIHPHYEVHAPEGTIEVHSNDRAFAERIANLPVVEDALAAAQAALRVIADMHDEDVVERPVTARNVLKVARNYFAALTPTEEAT